MRTLLAADAGSGRAPTGRRRPSTPPRRRGRRTALLAVIVSVTAVGVVACTGDDSPAAAPTPRATVELAWTANLDPISGLTMVGDTAVVYATTPDGLTLNGLDPATGAIRWTQAAAPLADREGLAVGVLDDGAAVAYYRPDGRARQARLVIADAATGADRTTSEARWWTGWPTECDGDVGGVCADASVQLDTGFWNGRPVRMDARTGQVGPVTADASIGPDDAYLVGAGTGLYFDSSSDGPERLARWSDGGQLWQRPLPDFFGPSVDSATSWTAVSGPTADTRVISVRVHPGDDRANDLSTDWGTALVDLRDGATRWQTKGATLTCGNDDLPRVPAGDVLLCRYTGVATEAQDDTVGEVTATSGLSVTVERVDAATGTPRWSAALGDAPALVANANAPRRIAVLDDTKVLVPTSTGSSVLDVTDGSVTTPDAEQQFWCVSTDRFPLPQPHYSVGSPITEAERYDVVQRCRADGSAVPPDSLPLDVPDAVATTIPGDDAVEQIRLVSEPGGVHAYRVPPTPVASDQDADLSTSSADVATSSSASAPAAPAPQPWPTDVREAWSFGGVRPVSPVTMIGDTAVYYGLLSSRLLLVGLDPATGAEKWRRDTTTAGLYANAAVTVQEFNGKIIALLPPTDPIWSVADVAIALVDPANGRDILTTETRRWRTQPGTCADDATRICAIALIGPTGQNGTEELSIDPATASIGAAPTADGRFAEIDRGLVEVKDQSVATVGRLDGDDLAWSRPLSELIGGPVTRDNVLVYGRAVDVFLLSTEGDSTTTDSPRLDLSTQLRSAGFAVADGAPIWQQPGTSNLCRGTTIAVGQVSLPGSEFGVTRCRYTGTLTIDRSTGARTSGGDLTATLERFDPATGSAVWTLPLGDVPALVSGDQGEIPILDDTRPVIAGKVVDMDDGRTRDADPSEVFWCPGQDTFYQSVPYNASDTGTDVRVDRKSSGLAALCSTDGSVVTDTDPSGTGRGPSPAAVPLAFATPTDGGLRLVSFDDRVVAYQVPR